MRLTRIEKKNDREQSEETYIWFLVSLTNESERKGRGDGIKETTMEYT